jgi:hypothetical protein
MNKKLAVFAIACALAFAGFAVLAQDTAQAPKPGPEHEKLAYFVGKWKAEGDVADNPFMPGGKFETKDDCRWFDGGFAVVCDSEGRGPMGKMKGLGIMSYSAEDKTYTYYGLDNMGMTMSTVPKGTVEGSTWTYHDESRMGGMNVKSRYVLEQVSATSYTFKWEMQGDDGSWQTIMQGKSTKTG